MPIVTCFSLSLLYLFAPTGAFAAGYCDLDGDNDGDRADADDACGDILLEKNLGGGAASCPDSNANQCSTGQFSGNPVSNSTGNKFQQEQDYASYGPDPLVWTRYYNSLSGSGAGTLGNNWSHGYNARIQVVDSTHVNAIRADEKTFAFHLVGSVWKADNDVNTTLTKIAAGGWQYTNGSDGVETFDAQGRLAKISNRAGLAQQLGYDAQNRLHTITNAFGITLQLDYDAQNRIQTVTDPANKTIVYGYGTNNNLTSVTYQDANIRQYVYENRAWPHALTGIIDEKNQRYATWNYYDDTGKAKSSEHAGFEKVTLAYDTVLNQTTVQYPPNYTSNSAYPVIPAPTKVYSFGTILGVAHTLSEDYTSTLSRSAQPWIPHTFAYNLTDGNLKTEIDFNGNRTDYIYDTASDSSLRTKNNCSVTAGASVRNLESCHIEGLSKTGATTDHTRTIKTEWDTRFRLPVKKSAKPNEESSWSYDDHGNMTGYTITDTMTPKSRTWTYTYTYDTTVTGAVVKMVEDGPRTDITKDLVTTEYYKPNENCSNGSVGCRGQIKTITDGLSHATTFNTYNAHGQPTNITDQNGVVRTLWFDSRQRLANYTTASETTRLNLDKVGQIYRSIQPSGYVQWYEHNAAHYLTRVAEGGSASVEYTPDNMGNLFERKIYDGATLISDTQTYNDYLGRLLTAVGGGGETTTYDYDNQGNLTDQYISGDHISFGYDELNRVNQKNEGYYSTGFDHDEDDRLVSLKDPNSHYTNYIFDGLGDLKTETSPDRGTLLYDYNEAGKIKTFTDNRGAVHTYTYDALNRPTKRTHTTVPNVPAAPAITWKYDETQLSDGTLTNGIGRLTSFTDESGSTTLAYDGHGRLKQKTQTTATATITPQTQTLRYDYDPITGVLKSQTYPSGLVVSYGNYRGKVSDITLSNGLLPTNSTITLLNNLSYLPFGTAPKGWTWGNAQTYTRSYNKNLQLKSYPLGTTRRTLKYFYDLFVTDYLYQDTTKNRQFSNYSDGSLSTDYAPNDPNASAMTYRYDSNGNPTYFYDANAIISNPFYHTFIIDPYKNQIGTVTDEFGNTIQNYSYDDASNITNDGKHGFTWNARGLLYKAATGANATFYRYNAFGERTIKSGANGLVRYAYDAKGHLVGEYDSGNNLIQETIYLGDIPVAVVKPDAVAGLAVYYVHADHLNAPRVILKPNGGTPDTVPVWRWDSDAFGNGLPDQDPDGDGIAFEYNLRFPGQYYDKETGLHYNHHRYYDPKTGRYISPDPIGLAGGTNPYAYVGNNPLTRIDPLGLDSVLIFQTEPDYWQKSQLPDSWNNAASYAGGLALNSCVNCNPSDIHVLPVNTVDQVNSALSSFSDITQIYFIGHSSNSSLYIGSRNLPNTNISNNNGANNVSPSKLNWSNLKSGAAINIWGCRSGQGKNSIAQQISNASGATTNAPNQFLNFDATGKPFFQPWRSGSFNTFSPNK